MLVPQEPRGSSESERDAVVDHLRSLVGEGRLELTLFEDLAARAYAASSYDELEAIVVAAPPPVQLTPAAHRRQDGLEVDVGHGQVKLEGEWQLAERTSVRVGHGQAIIDLTRATWDSRHVDLTLDVRHGQIVVTVPDGIRVSFERIAANVSDRRPQQRALPGAPTLHLRTSVGHGQIVVQSPRRRRHLMGRLRERRSLRR